MKRISGCGECLFENKGVDKRDGDDLIGVIRRDASFDEGSGKIGAASSEIGKCGSVERFGFLRRDSRQQSKSTSA